MEREASKVGSDDISNEPIEALMSRLKSMVEQNGKFYKKNVECISSLMSQIKSMYDELKSEHEKNSQSLVELLQQSFGECENSVGNASVKFHELNEKFCEDKASHQQAPLQALDGKKEKSMISAIADKVAKLDKSLKIQEEIHEEFKILVQTLCFRFPP
ncbi:uncharacterized protein LOC104432062 [Eucalyptus grandis]|uniref:uncharacterized protein LOC104432062 n=1 Tax=Eucalyptus grandis TaxID=71139 RepID=UPI00192F09BB|nr:uncharacterized protein LOC104432062 [Eucalyptus grandis]